MQWWTPAPDIPLVAFDSSVFDTMVDSLKISIGAIASKGFLILGVCLSVVLISSIFRSLLLNKVYLFEGTGGRSFRRSVSSSDVRLDLDSGSGGRVPSADGGLFSRGRSRRSGADLNEQVHRRQSAFGVNVSLRDRKLEAQENRRETYLNCAKDYYRKRGRR